MRVSLRREIFVPVPPHVVWDYVTDWPRQGEWVPGTRVERVDRADGVGGRIRAWTGAGPIGFWDPMTITAWEVAPDGSGRCVMLHTGSVVRGEGEFAVTSRGPDRCEFIWTERLDLPFGRLGELAWRLAAPLAGAMLAAALRRLAAKLQHGRS